MKRMILLAILLLSFVAYGAEIEITGNGVVILSGDVTPSAADGTILPDAIQLGPPTSATFRPFGSEGRFGCPIAVFTLATLPIFSWPDAT